MQLRLRLLSFIPLISLVTSSGCLLLQDGGATVVKAGQQLDTLVNQRAARAAGSAQETESDRSGVVANPRAKSIRFDQEESILALHNAVELSSQDFHDRLKKLIQRKKFRSARSFIAIHRRAAETLFWKQWSTTPTSAELSLVARVLSDDCGESASWTSLLQSAADHPLAANSYATARAATKDHSFQEAEASVEELRGAMQALPHPRIRIDALRLLASLESRRKRHAWGESLLLQAIEVARSHGDLFAVSKLHLARIANARSGEAEVGNIEEIWLQAVRTHAAAQMKSAQAIRAEFWHAAAANRPHHTDWPDIALETLRSNASVGFAILKTTPAELLVYFAIGNAYFESGRPQRALLQFKAAEGVTANQEQQYWLHLAQSECLTALGQHHAATTLLAPHLDSSSAKLAAAAGACLGSAKLQQGAFQQGAKLLDRALSGSLDWPKRHRAAADLALARLILGEEAAGYTALHAAQKMCEAKGDLVTLLQALENEASLLEFQQRPSELHNVRDRIEQLERT